MHIEMRDGVVLDAEPAGIVGHVAVPFGQWYNNISFA